MTFLRDVLRNILKVENVFWEHLLIMSLPSAYTVDIILLGASASTPSLSLSMTDAIEGWRVTARCRPTKGPLANRSNSGFGIGRPSRCSGGDLGNLVLGGCC